MQYLKCTLLRTRLSIGLLAIGLLCLAVDVAVADDLQSKINKSAENDVLTITERQLDSPLTIQKPLTLKAEAGKEVLLDVTADRPALRISGKGPVVIDGITIKWQLATSQGRGQEPAAVWVQDCPVTFKNCKVIASGNAKRCPTALLGAGFSKVNVEGCRFEGFEFTVNCAGGAEMTMTDCELINPGHCGASVFSGSTLEVTRTLVTGSKYHGLRSSGGTIDIHDNLIIANKNRGIYLGNKAALGRVHNNVIADNGTGISAFGGSEVVIENNVFSGNEYSGVDSRSSCPLNVKNNIFTGNVYGFVLFKDEGRNTLKLGANCFWDNETDLKDIAAPESILRVDPEINNADAGDFSAKAEAVKKMGLEKTATISGLWKKHLVHQR
ncbi:right-handed parallel beta-helix repeat-containing protein [Thalassoglobus polymorphus]|uniref:Right handed beta helix domain-containing protein n=1 Tax=Thalassoglobus polymorphus TaxID=2527994 RepID=A0A517QKJ4_9PLAN|nr:right-handed parallel beta-helix repeat-containing protein [Thalassoglobus polymorphus]QDT32153.1 hypothetical protein Mal48_13950 [Thalassoglobus polymorphus]